MNIENKPDLTVIEAATKATTWLGPLFEIIKCRKYYNIHVVLSNLPMQSRSALHVCQLGKHQSQRNQKNANNCIITGCITTCVDYGTSISLYRFATL